MPSQISCPHCGAPIRVRSKHIGKPGRCPKCHKLVMIRAPDGSDYELPSSQVISRKAFATDDGFDEEARMDDSFVQAVATASGQGHRDTANPTPRPSRQPAAPGMPVRPRVHSNSSNSSGAFLGACIAGILVIGAVVWGLTYFGQRSGDRAEVTQTGEVKAEPAGQPVLDPPAKAPAQVVETAPLVTGSDSAASSNASDQPGASTDVPEAKPRVPVSPVAADPITEVDPTEFEPQAPQRPRPDVFRDPKSIVTNPKPEPVYAPRASGDVVVGDQAQEIVGRDKDGKEFRLSDYRGRVVLLKFWSAECGICQSMVKSEKAIADRYQRSKFAIVGVNLNAPGKAKLVHTPVWRDFVDGEQGPIASNWVIRSLPTHFIIDADGLVTEKFEGFTDAKTMNAAIRDAMKLKKSGPGVMQPNKQAGVKSQR